MEQIYVSARENHLPSVTTLRDRGFVDENSGRVVETCSLAYLHILYLELSRARSFVLVSIQHKPRIEEQVERLDFLVHEFERLFKFPSLYPSSAVKARFLVLCFHLDCEYHFMKSCKDLLVNKELREVQHSSHHHLVQPTYMQDSHGWENFLLPGAPGSRLGHKKTEPESVFQVLPGLGLRMCSDFQREENEIVQYAYGTNTTFTSKTFRSLPFDFVSSLHRSEKNCSGRSPFSRLRSHTQSIVLNPSPFRQDLGIRLDIRSSNPTQLEEFSQFIYRAEQQGPAPNAPAAALNAPNAFPVMGIRSWHRPLRPWDLHYHSEPPDQCECHRTE